MPKTQTKRPVNPHFNPYPKLGFLGTGTVLTLSMAHHSALVATHLAGNRTSMVVGGFALWPVATAVFSKHHL